MTITYEQDLKYAADGAASRIEYDSKVLEIINNILSNEEPFTVSKRWTGYGTWRVSVEVNSLIFGSELAEYIKDNLVFATHDEDREFRSFADMEQQVRDVIENYAFELF